MKAYLLPLLIAAASACAQPSVVQLSFLDGLGPTSEPLGISPDGRTIVGYSAVSFPAPNLAARWTTQPNGQIFIGLLPGADAISFDTSCTDISADGNVILTNSFPGTVSNAYYWTPENNLQLIPFTPNPFATFGQVVSYDGQIIAGTMSPSSGSFKPFVWDRRTANAVLLPTFPGSSVPSGGISGMNANGTRFVGTVQINLTTAVACYWDGNSNPVALSTIGDRYQAVSATACSADGTVIVGAALDTQTGGGIGFVWTAAEGVVPLPRPTTGQQAIVTWSATNISGDGLVITGTGENVRGENEAIFWVNRQPFRVVDVLFAAGTLPLQWEPSRLYAVDHFGNALTGIARNQQGKVEAFKFLLDANFDPLPGEIGPVNLTRDATTGEVTITFDTAPGAEYRILGGTRPNNLTEIDPWTAATGLLRTFATTPGSDRYFLSVEGR